MNWFTELTGLTSDTPDVVRQGIVVDGPWLESRANGRRMHHGSLATPYLADLPRPRGKGLLCFREVVADVRALHQDPRHEGAIFQVASQFNLLEMIGPHVTPEAGIARYAKDRTQGPACAMACAAGTIYRNYFVPMAGQVGQSASLQLDMAADLGHALGNTDGSLWRMRNGYLLPEPGALQRIANVMREKAESLRPLLRLGLHGDTEVTLAGAGHRVNQVYASALPLAYSSQSTVDWEPFARLILESAYETTFRLAGLHADRGDNPTLFLTRLGGGAFGNPDAWITEAIHRAAQNYDGPSLEVVLVSYGQADPANRGLLQDWG
jgi:hypothetical protein